MCKTYFKYLALPLPRYFNVDFLKCDHQIWTNRILILRSEVHSALSCIFPRKKLLLQILEKICKTRLWVYKLKANLRPVFDNPLRKTKIRNSQIIKTTCFQQKQQNFPYDIIETIKTLGQSCERVLRNSPSIEIRNFLSKTPMLSLVLLKFQADSL